MTLTKTSLISLALLMVCSTTSSLAMHASSSPSPGTTDELLATFSIRGSMGVVQGEAREIVYTKLNDGSTHKLSELIWDLSNVWMAGGIVSANLLGMIDVNIGYWMGITEGDGDMDDYDWMIPDFSWSDWSHGDVTVDDASLLDANAAIRLPFIPFIAAKAILGYKQQTWEWSDYGGSFVYSRNGFRDYRGEFDDEVGIIYEQTFSLPYVGLGADITIGPLYVDAYLLFSNRVSAEDNDLHVSRNIYFEETFSGGEFIAVGASGRLRVTDGLFLAASLDIQEFDEIVGDMTATDLSTGVSEFAPNGAGISHSSYMMSGSVCFVF